MFPKKGETEAEFTIRMLIDGLAFQQYLDGLVDAYTNKADPPSMLNDEVACHKLISDALDAGRTGATFEPCDYAPIPETRSSEEKP